MLKAEWSICRKSGRMRWSVTIVTIFDAAPNGFVAVDRRKFLALGDLMQGHRLTVAVVRQIKKGLHRVPATGRNFHRKGPFPTLQYGIPD